MNVTRFVHNLVKDGRDPNFMNTKKIYTKRFKLVENINFKF